MRVRDVHHLIRNILTIQDPDYVILVTLHLQNQKRNEVSKKIMNTYLVHQKKIGILCKFHAAKADSVQITCKIYFGFQMLTSACAFIEHTRDPFSCDRLKIVIWVFHDTRFYQIIWQISTQAKAKRNCQKLPPVGIGPRSSGSSL